MPKINSAFTTTVRNPGRDAVLLDYLAGRFPYHTQAEWLSLLTLGRLALDGRMAAAGDPLREGQLLRFAVVDYEEADVPTDFEVLAETEDLRLVHKPAGLPVHRTGKIFFGTLANLARERWEDAAWSPLNRLDRETSGLVAFARGPAALRAYAPSQSDCVWIKMYAAVTQGSPPAERGCFNPPLMERPESAIRCRMHAHPDGKRAATLFRTVEARAGRALVALMPITGRKHQLRAHLAAAGCPVVGDKIYSLNGRAYLKQLNEDLDEADYRELGAQRHLLHAFYLGIKRTPKTQGVDGPLLEAWDWDAGPEFERCFSVDALRRWAASADFREMAEQAEAARGILATPAVAPATGSG